MKVRFAGPAISLRARPAQRSRARRPLRSPGTLERKAHFQALVNLGFARSRGQGLGGEGFAPTETGRKAPKAFSPRPFAGRGFAGMSPERRRAIARMGGKSAPPPEQRAFARDRDVAAYVLDEREMNRRHGLVRKPWPESGFDRT
jgi:Stress-induced bacterial acidophilic repeat motif